jgi:hypothetical protein
MALFFSPKFAVPLVAGSFVHVFSSYVCTSSPVSTFVTWDVGFEVLTAAVMKTNIFRNIKPCSPFKVNRRLGGTYRLHIQLFDREDGGDIFLRKVGLTFSGLHGVISQELLLSSVVTSICYLQGLPYRHLWADCLDNVGPSTSQNSMGLHGLLTGIALPIGSIWFKYTIYIYIYILSNSLTNV